MTSETVAPSQLGIGRVIQRTWAITKVDFGAKFGIAALLAGLPSALSNYLQARAIEGGNTTGFTPLFALSVLVAIAGTIILQAALIRSAADQIEGRAPRLGDSVSAGLRMFLPILGLSLLTGLAVACGMIALVAPGVMMACAWSVGLPVMVLEATGVFATFRRSADLTRGSRWRIFGLFWAYIGIVIAVAIVFGIAVVVVSIPLAAAGLAVIFVSLLNGLFTAAITLVVATGATVLYDELRSRPQRSPVQEIVDILR